MADKQWPYGNPLVLALDPWEESLFGMNTDDLLTAVLDRLAPLKGLVGFVKVNSILRRIGFDLIGMLHDEGFKVFADLKLFDIGNTASADLKFLYKFEPELLTIAVDAGPKTLEDAVKFRWSTKILGVTILTSMEDEDVDTLHHTDRDSAVFTRATIAKEQGCQGLVCSGHELSTLKDEAFAQMIKVVPALRPAWTQVAGDDQAKKMTPAEAVEKGATLLVMGRPLMKKDGKFMDAAGCEEAVRRTLAEIGFTL